MGSTRPWQGRVCALCCSTGDLNTPHVSLPAVPGGTRPSQPAGKGSEHCCLVPSHVLMPWGGGSPDAGGTHGESPLLRDWQSGTARCWHLPTLRPLSHPPCAQPPGAAGLHCPGTGLAREFHLLLVLALPGDTHPHCTHGSVPSSWHRGRGASPAGLCKGTLGTAERLPRKTPCAAREQPVSCQGTGQSCSLVSLPRREHAGSGVTAPRRRPVECRIPKPTLNPGVPRLPPCQAPR